MNSMINSTNERCIQSIGDCRGAASKPSYSDRIASSHTPAAPRDTERIGSLLNSHGAPGGSARPPRPGRARRGYMRWRARPRHGSASGGARPGRPVPCTRRGCARAPPPRARAERAAPRAIAANTAGIPRYLADIPDDLIAERKVAPFPLCRQGKAGDPTSIRACHLDHCACQTAVCSNRGFRIIQKMATFHARSAVIRRIPTQRKNSSEETNRGSRFCSLAWFDPH